MSYFMVRGLWIYDPKSMYLVLIPQSKDWGIILCTLSARGVTGKLDLMRHASYVPP